MVGVETLGWVGQQLARARRGPLSLALNLCFHLNSLAFLSLEVDLSHPLGGLASKYSRIFKEERVRIGRRSSQAGQQLRGACVRGSWEARVLGPGRCPAGTHTRVYVSTTTYHDITTHM